MTKAEQTGAHKAIVARVKAEQKTNLTVFHAENYAWAVAHSDVSRLARPVTLADHEAAEREARKILDRRLTGEGRCDYDTVPEISEIEAGEDEGQVDALADWGQDIENEARGWEKIANDLIAFKAKAAKKAA
jgi:hypothetical protein